MSVIAAAVKHLLAAGVTGDALVAAIVDMEASLPSQRDEQAERRRSKDRDRKRATKAIPQNSAESAESAETPPLSPLMVPPKNISNPPLNPPNPPVTNRARGAVSKPIAGFAEFWGAYPRKTAKAAAEKAWPKACQRSEPAQIIAAARRYAADPPDDPQFIPHPATWLNQARFEDEPDGNATDRTARTAGNSNRMGGNRQPTYRPNPALDGLKRLHAEFAGGWGSEAIESH